jgi:hypothetical protein
MRSFPLLAAAALVSACGAIAPDSKSVRADTAHGDVFERQPENVAYATVDSLLRIHCTRCHSGNDAAQDVDLSSFEHVMRGQVGEKPLIMVGNPALSAVIDVVRSTRSRRPETGIHADSVRPISNADFALLANWVSAGAQPSGTPEERLTATLRQYVVALNDAEQRFHAKRARFTTSLDSLRMIPVVGVTIAFRHADMERWEARLSHPRLRERCVVSGDARTPAKKLDLTSAAALCKFVQERTGERSPNDSSGPQRQRRRPAVSR